MYCFGFWVSGRQDEASKAFSAVLGITCGGSAGCAGIRIQGLGVE